MSGAKLAWLTVAWACLHLPSAWACRYNVRDVGFVDLGNEPYHLYVFYNGGTPAQTVLTFRELSSSAFRTSNMAVQIVNVDEQADPPGLKYLSPEAARSWPATVLASPDGPVLPLALLGGGILIRENLAAALRGLVSSPTRETILDAVSTAFAAVLLIEGDDPAANHRARQAVSDAQDAIRRQLKLLPKVIDQAPVLVVLEAASLAREKILLWTLGLDTTRTAFPRAAILYGRARWMGPLMKGDEISVRNLTGLLSIIGADCECGLDLSWTLGTRLPVNWDEARQARMAKLLGFDPENPLIKLEVSRMVGRGGSRPGTAARAVTGPAATGPAEVATTIATGSRNVQGPREPGASARPAAPADGIPVLQPSFVVLAGLAVVAVAAGLFILVRSGR